MASACCSRTALSGAGRREQGHPEHGSTRGQAAPSPSPLLFPSLSPSPSLFPSPSPNQHPHSPSRTCRCPHNPSKHPSGEGQGPILAGAGAAFGQGASCQGSVELCHGCCCDAQGAGALGWKSVKRPAPAHENTPGGVRDGFSGSPPLSSPLHPSPLPAGQDQAATSRASGSRGSTSAARHRSSPPNPSTTPSPRPSGTPSP